MAKLFNFVIIVSGLLALLALAGFPTATNQLLAAVGLTISNEGVSLSSQIVLVAAVVAITALLGISASTGGSISAGGIVISSPDSKLVASLALLLMNWGIFDLASVIRLAIDTQIAWIGVITTLIVGPMMLAYLIAIIAFWRGSDI